MILYHCFIKYKENPQEPKQLVDEKSTKNSKKNLAFKKGQMIALESPGEKLDLAEKAPEQMDYLVFTHF